jgi:predicted histidine transporter YuiF (NhaC family)
MFHIFERLNTGGTPLKAQEIRNFVFHGTLVDSLHEANEDTDWRTILGRKPLDRHQRVVEMILRIFAMSERGNEYEKPMKEFLNQQMRNHTKGKGTDKVEKIAERFGLVTAAIVAQLDPKPFHIRGPLNLAAIDSVMAVLIRNPTKIPDNLKARSVKLLADDDYRKAIFFNTSDPREVEKRLRLANKHLMS